MARLFQPHIFAGNHIDRGDVLRRSEAELLRLTRSDNCRVLLFMNFQPLIRIKNSETASLVWLPLRQASRVAGNAKRIETFLGIDPHDDAPLVAWNLTDAQHQNDSEISGVELSQIGDAALSFTEAREAATIVSGSESGIIAQAKSNLEWHHRHGYCSRCGNPTLMRRGGLMRECNRCNSQHFPRTDPVVITVVAHGDSCLLGQSAGRLRSMNMYSALAGFMDQGEAMEEAVRREVKEESGIEVGEVQYHSTQPWPFPSSLMIGSHAQALSSEIDKDDFEMTDVRWFSRDEVLLALERKHPSLNVPGDIAIAHHLIKAWANGEAGDFQR